MVTTLLSEIGNWRAPSWRRAKELAPRTAAPRRTRAAVCRPVRRAKSHACGSALRHRAATHSLAAPRPIARARGSPSPAFGQLNFNNTDLARAAGWPRPNQALGNLVSRLDLCCAKAGLPAIGCAAAAFIPSQRFFAVAIPDATGGQPDTPETWQNRAIDPTATSPRILCCGEARLPFWY
jgi:hypothetical protein